MKLLRARLAGLGAVMGSNLPDLLMVTGAASVAYGAWLLHPAAGFITGGLLLLVGGIIASRGGN